ncbi:MAG: hypothetical protein R2713_02855 [Ilumatobacteraceae bacterium]
MSLSADRCISGRSPPRRSDPRRVRRPRPEAAPSHPDLDDHRTRRGDRLGAGPQRRPATAGGRSRGLADHLLWIINGYTMVLALLLPIGAIGDRFGRKPVLLLV